MNHWLIKSEPAKYGFADLVREGQTNWDGVRNNQAALYLKAMAVGDLALFYESVTDPGVAGIARVSRTAFPDPSDASGRFVAVEVEPERALAQRVPLAALKAEPKLAGMTMFRQFRLSVTPVTADEWALIVAMGEG